MTPSCQSAPATAALDYDSTIVGALELSSTKWMLAVQLPGVARHSRYTLAANGPELAALIEKLKTRAAAAGRTITRVILTYEAGRDGFWIARFLQRRRVEVHVMQSSSLPVDRKARRAKTDVIDVEMLLRALLAFLRGEPRVCSMVPIPDEVDEEARRAHREREDMIGERKSIVNKIGGILATLGVTAFKALRRDRRAALKALLQPDGDPLPEVARSRIERLLDRLELILTQIAVVEKARDAVAAKAEPENNAERMIKSLVELYAIGPELATLLVREIFVRPIRNRRALGSYVGITGTPYASGGRQREQGISKAGNARARAGMLELAWLWLRWQPDSALSVWFRQRVGDSKGRIRKIMIVALARKLLIALWRFARDGVLPEGAKMKTA